MKRIGYLVAAVGVAAAFLAAPLAYSTEVLSPKKALFQGLTVAKKAAPEATVSRLIVKFKDATPAERAVRLLEVKASVGLELQPRREMAGGGSLVSLGRSMPLSEAKAIAARVATHASVEYAEPDVLMKALMVPNDPRYSDWQWNLFAPTSIYTGTQLDSTRPKSTAAVGGANLPTAWDVAKGGSTQVVVAVIDTGIANHPDLNGIASPAPYTPAGRFVSGYDFISSDVEAGTLPLNFTANDGDGRDPDPTDPGDWITAAESTQYPTSCPGGAADSSWHGTHMTGSVAAATNNGIGIAGVAWNVRVQPIRALGKCGGLLSDIAEAIRWAAGLNVPGVPANPTPAKVISLSLGGADTCPSYMQEAVTAATNAGSVVVAATGNDGSATLIAPANCTGAIAVTAHTINGENADYANVGAGVAISAPGGGPPASLGAGGPTDDSNWTGYYIWSSVLFGATTPTSSDSENRSGAAYAGFTGTSAATPQVAGVAALIKSALPSATPAQVRSILTSSARAFPPGSVCAAGQPLAGMCGAGLLDAAAAVGGATSNAPPTIVDGPNSVAVFEGQAATLSVAAVGAPTLAYQWASNGKNIAGATASSYTTPALTIADSGTRYSVAVSNSLGTVTSAEATVTVTAASSAVPPAGGGGGGGALPLLQVLMLAALMLAARIRRRE